MREGGQAAVKTPLPEAYLPRRAPVSAWRQTGWRSLDRREGVRQGTLTEAQGADPRALPALSILPTPVPAPIPAVTGRALSMHTVNGILYVLTEANGAITLWVLRDGSWATLSLDAVYPGQPRTVLPFTYYNHPNDPLDTDRNYPMVLIFPDGYYIRPDQSKLEKYTICKNVDSELPYFTHACTHLSRVFGVGEDRAYASDHNRVTEWQYDEPDNVSASHAWVTASQAGGERHAGHFTAIVSFAGMLLAFKERACYAIGGTKNPFRIRELLSVGTADARTVAQVGTDLFFCDREQVYRFDGGEVREIGAPLGITDFSGALGAAGRGLYYLYVPSCRKTFVYASDTGAWSELYPFTGNAILAMTSNGNGDCLFLDSEGSFYTTKESDAYSFSIKTSELIPDLPAPARLLRVRVTAKAEQGASLSLSCCLSDGRTLPLATIEGDGRTLRQSVPVPAVADTAASLHFTGNGKISITSLDLVTAETATDGT